MKFSYQLLKKLVPKIENKSGLIEKLILYAFEAEDLGGDMIEIFIPANRYSDAASHWGMARIISAIYGRNFQFPISNPQFSKPKCKEVEPLKIEIKDTDLCPRYMGWYFEVPKIAASPKWMQDILISCGLRPVNSVVDIMNYTMLETGQPLHAFDVDKLTTYNKQLTTIIVRRAKKREKIITLDNEVYELNEKILVIADDKDSLAIAGIKGGKKAEVDNNTKRIIVEAANFESTRIYKTSRQINLTTDASVRFGHGLSPVLAERGIKRAAELLEEICQAKAGKLHDIGFLEPSRKVLKFDIDRFNKLTGLNLREKACFNYLKKLGFSIKNKLVEVPPERMDVSIFEDLVEEIVNLYGYNKVPVAPPHVYLRPSGYEEINILKDKVRKILVGFGLSEVYNYSFISKYDLEKSAGRFFGGEPIAVKNPISSQFEFLRPSLSCGLLKNTEDNSRFFESVRIFEIGKVFPEKLVLGIAASFKKGKPVLELKGWIEELLKEIGLTDYFMPDLNFDLRFLDSKESLRIESDHSVLGYFGSTTEGNVAIAELDLEKLLVLAVGEKEFEPLAKYPEIIRDLSIIIPRHIRSSEVFEIIENAAPKYLDDVDLIDVYEDLKIGENNQSLTFRLVFLADDRTLTDQEVDKEMKRITTSLEEEFNAEIR